MISRVSLSVLAVAAPRVSTAPGEFSHVKSREAEVLLSRNPCRLKLFPLIYSRDAQSCNNNSCLRRGLAVVHVRAMWVNNNQAKKYASCPYVGANPCH